MSPNRQASFIVLVPLVLVAAYLAFGKHPKKIDNSPPPVLVSTFSLPGKTGYTPKLHAKAKTRPSSTPALPTGRRYSHSTGAE
jgi:hypothetical protein